MLAKRLAGKRLSGNQVDRSQLRDKYFQVDPAVSSLSREVCLRCLFCLRKSHTSLRAFSVIFRVADSWNEAHIFSLFYHESELANDPSSGSVIRWAVLSSKDFLPSVSFFYFPNAIFSLIKFPKRLTARSSADPVTRSLFEQTKAIVFYSTPHKGSHLAALNPTSQIIVWPSVEVQELRESEKKKKNFSFYQFPLEIIKSNISF